MAEEELESVEAEEAEAPVQDAAEAEAPAIDPEIEAEARKYGWRDQSEFNLKPEGWVDASRFLELPATRWKREKDRNAALDRELRELRDMNARIERTTKTAVERARQQERQRYEAELRDIEARRLEAVETGDVEKFRQFDQQAQDLQRRAQEPAQNQGAHPDVESYRQSEAGAWINDRNLASFAANLIQNDPGALALPPLEQVKWAERKVREYMPDRFKSEPKPEPKPQVQRVDGGGLAQRKRSKGVDDLPREAREAGKGFVEQGLFKDLGEYARDYWAQEGV